MATQSSMFVSEFVRTTRRADFDNFPRARADIMGGAAGTAAVFAELARCGLASERAVRTWHAEMLARGSDAQTAFVSTFPGDGVLPKSFRVGPASGPSGMSVATVEVAHALADSALFAAGAKAFAAHWKAALSSPHLRAELYGGSAGYAVHAARMLRFHDELMAAPSSAPVSPNVRAVLTGVRDQAREHLLESLTVSLGMRSNTMLGAAHGVTGELFAALVTEGPVPAYIEARLDELSKLALVDGSLIAWPATLGGEVPADSWSTFCNGTPGQLLLYSAAVGRFGQAEHARMAERCANTTMALGAGKLGTLCCGVGGHVVALAEHAGAVKSERSHHAARRRLKRTMALVAKARRHKTTRLAFGNGPSFLQGAGGVALLAARAHARRPLGYWFR